MSTWGNLQRIIICHNFYAQAGGESAVFENLVRGLKERGHKVIPFLADNKATGSLSITGAVGLVGSAYYSTRIARDLRRSIEIERPDLAIVQNVFPVLSPSVYTTLHELKIPVIQTIYNYRLVCPAGELYSHGEICERCLHGNYMHCAVRKCYRNSFLQSAWYASIIGWHRWMGTFARTIDVFQVPDRFMADKLAQGGLPREKMVRNVNPFFVGDYQPTDAHDGYIAYAGRLVRHKGVLTLLEAARLSKRVRLVIVGHGELESEIETFVRRHDLADRVSLVGAQWGEKLTDVLLRACAVAIPSEWYDNLPLTLCQANALGKPVLASRINGIPEYVDPGVNGFLFNPGDALELSKTAEAVLSLDAGSYRELAHTSRQFAEQKFDFEQHYQVLSRIFGELSGGLTSGQESSRRH